MARSRYADDRDDDYEDDRPPPAKQGGGGGTAVKIVAIVGAVVVVIVLICGGAVAIIGYSIYSGVHGFANKVEKMADQAQQQQNSQEESKRFAEGFLRDVRNNRLDSAYQSTSAAYQKRVSRKDFETFLTTHPGVAKTQSPMLMPHNYNPFANTGRFDFEFTELEAGGPGQPGRFNTVIVTVIKDGDKWNVDDLVAD
jgi:predicted metalloprotease